MSNCVTCFGRGTVIGSDGQPKPCPNPQCDAPTGEPAATFTDWHRQYGRMVRRIAVTELRHEDAALAEDIAQEVWLQLWVYVVGGAQVERPASLLATITRRTVGMHYRRVAASMRPRTRAVDYTDRLIERIIATDSAEDVASVRLAARDELDSTAPNRRRHAPRRTDQLLALAVSA